MKVEHTNQPRRPSTASAGGRWCAGCIIAVLATLCTSNQALGHGLQDHAGIRAAAQAAAHAIARSMAPDGAKVTVEAARLDPRLTLAACPLSLETPAPTNRTTGARLSIQVRCPVEGGWSLYVPVRVRIDLDVVVLGAAAGRGEILSAAHLRIEERDVAQLTGGYLTRLEDAEHKVLRRPVSAGTALAATALELPKIVRRGQRVRVISATAGFTVESEGEALTDAAAGDRVRVRNLGSRQIIEGVVDEAGQVRVGGAA